MSRTIRRAIAVLTILILAASGCGNSGDDDDASDDGGATDDAAEPSGEEERDTFVSLQGVPGVTDEEISFAAIGTRENNPLGTCILDCYLDGINAYFAFRNSEGGIYKRDLVVDDIDDALGNNQARSLEVVASDDYFGAFQATLVPSGWADLDDAGVPTYAWGIHATEAANRSHIWPSTPIQCADCTGRGASWLATEAGATTVAALGYGTSENSKVCTNNAAAAIELYSEDTGLKVGYVKDDLAFGLGGGIAPEVTAMKEAGVDFITTCMDLNGMQTLAEELNKQGMEDVVLLHPNTYNQAFVAENADLFEGDYVSVQFRPFEADAEGTALEDFLHWMEETGAEPSELAMAGWLNATLAFDGLLAAGPEFDRDKVTAATNAITDFTAGGLIETVDWTQAHTPYTNDTRPDDEGEECAAVVRVVDGAFEVVAEPDKPWLCFPPGTEWAEPEPTTFG